MQEKLEKVHFTCIFHLTKEKSFHLIHDYSAPKNQKKNEFSLKYLIDSDLIYIICSHFQELWYCGSFYDGLKIGVPNEYDLNVVFRTYLLKNCVKVRFWH